MTSVPPPHEPGPEEDRAHGSSLNPETANIETFSDISETDSTVEFKGPGGTGASITGAGSVRRLARIAVPVVLALVGLFMTGTIITAGRSLVAASVFLIVSLLLAALAIVLLRPKQR